MKTVFLTALLVLGLSFGTAKAETVYLDFSEATTRGMNEQTFKAPYWAGGDGPGIVAKRLTKWENRNPDKKMICWHPNIVSDRGGEIYGVWITYEKKQK